MQLRRGRTGEGRGAREKHAREVRRFESVSPDKQEPKSDIMEKDNTSENYSPESEELAEGGMVIVYLFTGLAIAAFTGIMVYFTLFA